MTLHARQKCPDGQHLMSGTECIKCGDFVSPLAEAEKMRQQLADMVEAIKPEQPEK